MGTVAVREFSSSGMSLPSPFLLLSCLQPQVCSLSGLGALRLLRDHLGEREPWPRSQGSAQFSWDQRRFECQFYLAVLMSPGGS